MFHTADLLHEQVIYDAALHVIILFVKTLLLRYMHNMYVKNELLYYCRIYSSVLTPSSAQPPPTSSSTDNDHKTAPECLLEIRSTGRHYAVTRSILHTVQPALSAPPFLRGFEWRGNYSGALAVHWQSVGSFLLPVCLQIASVCTVCGTPGLYCCWSVSWPRTKLMTHKEQQWSRETMKGVHCSRFIYSSCHIFWSSILFFSLLLFLVNLTDLCTVPFTLSHVQF